MSRLPMVSLTAYQIFCRTSGPLNPITNRQKISTTRSEFYDKYFMQHYLSIKAISQKSKFLAKKRTKEDQNTNVELSNPTKPSQNRKDRNSIEKQLDEPTAVSGVEYTYKNYVGQDLDVLNTKHTGKDDNLETHSLEDIQIELNMLFRQDQEKIVVNQVIWLLEAIKQTFNVDSDISNNDQTNLILKRKDIGKCSKNSSVIPDTHNIVNSNSNQSTLMQNYRRNIIKYNNIRTDSDKVIQSNYDPKPIDLMIGNVLSNDELMAKIDMTTPLNNMQKSLMVHFAVLAAFNLLEKQRNFVANQA